MRRLLAASLRKLRGIISGSGRGGFVEIEGQLLMRDRTFTHGSAPAVEAITFDSAVEPFWLSDVGDVAPPESEAWCYCI